MTHQRQNDPGATSPSLEAKLRQFAGGLSPEEQAQLSSRRGTVTRDLAPSLQAKARRTVTALTPEEVAQLRRLLRRAGLAAATDVEGYLIGAFNDGQGGKGRPQPVTGTGGGGGFPDRFAHNVAVLFGTVIDELPRPGL